ncbi:MAG: hypothetical protein GX589_00085, partial [Deltaproteobacteria bacterium]|nr:hypothetical protein [Deltaproteobacteria bacterium]
MHFLTFASSIHDLHRFKSTHLVQEVLLEPETLTKQGRLSDEKAKSLAEAAREHHLKPVLVWDILMTEDSLKRSLDKLSNWDLGLLHAVRVHDLGAAYLLQKEWPQIQIQLLVNSGNHNLEALLGWQAHFGSQLDRMVLSLELPKEQLSTYIKTLSTPCEILGAGRILIFYSPRFLLSQNDQTQRQTDSSWIESLLHTNESGEQTFHALQTKHGTQLFLEEDWFILDQLQPLADLGLSATLIDLRHLSDLPNSADGIEEICNAYRLKQITADNWPRPVTSCFFKENRTSQIFSELKPKTGKLKVQGCLAEVISFEKQKYCAFWVHQNFNAAENTQLHIP